VCPKCGLDREGSEIESQRWWTVLGRRIVPLATFDRLIECTSCGHRCDTGAMEIPTTSMLVIILDEATRAAAIAVTRATIAVQGELTVPVLEAAVAAVRDADQNYDEQHLYRDLDHLEAERTADRLGRLRAELTAHGKQGFLRRMSEIAVVAGPMHDEERQAVLDVGRALGMAAPHINGVLAVAKLQHQAA
jgi:hypothetical protein